MMTTHEKTVEVLRTLTHEELILFALGRHVALAASISGGRSTMDSIYQSIGTPPELPSQIEQLSASIGDKIATFIDHKRRRN